MQGKIHLLKITETWNLNTIHYDKNIDYQKLKYKRKYDFDDLIIKLTSLLLRVLQHL